MVPGDPGVEQTPAASLDPDSAEWLRLLADAGPGREAALARLHAMLLRIARGYRGVMLGLPVMTYHLEFTQHDHGSPGLAPSRDNLLVLYLDDRAQVEQVAARLATLGHLPVEAGESVLDRQWRGHRRGPGSLAGRPDAAVAGVIGEPW